jgi:hypothetical protein
LKFKRCCLAAAGPTALAAPYTKEEQLAAVLNSPIPKVLFGGEEALITRVRFDVLDRAAVVEALDGARDMIREGGGPG